MKSSFKNEALLIKKLKLRYSLTQAKLGEISGVHGQYFSNVERGKCGLSLTNWKRLSANLIFDWEDVAIAKSKDKYEGVMNAIK